MTGPPNLSEQESVLIDRGLDGAHGGHCNVARKHEGIRVGSWHCHKCRSSFSVLSGATFSRTKIPLQKWFLAIALILNAKKPLSSHQLGP